MREWTREASELGFDLLWHAETDPSYEARIEQSMNRMHDYFGTAIDRRLKNPGDDVLTQIAKSGLTREESVSFARLLLVAGNETTTNLINHILRLMILHPTVASDLRQNSDLAVNMLAETLRFAPPIRGPSEKREQTQKLPEYRFTKMKSSGHGSSPRIETLTCARTRRNFNYTERHPITLPSDTASIPVLASHWPRWKPESCWIQFSNIPPT